MERTLVEDHRWVLRIFACKTPLGALTFTIPLLAFWITVASRSEQSLPVGMTLALAIGGVLYWSFIEYAIHRFLFHWSPNNRALRRVVESFHLYHHRNPADPTVLVSGPLQSVVVSLALLPVPLLILGDLPRVAVVMTALSASYYCYEWVHFLVHQRKYEGGLMGWAQSYHLTHHRLWKGNFGQTSPLWDILLGTTLKTRPNTTEENRRYILPEWART